jgi:adenine C2-methylase RlmN of 23S rRNA A2503 and tRNA A37
LDLAAGEVQGGEGGRKRLARGRRGRKMEGGVLLTMRGSKSICVVCGLSTTHRCSSCACAQHGLDREHRETKQGITTALYDSSKYREEIRDKGRQ